MPFTSIMEAIMRKLIEKLGVVRVGFICVFAMMFICTLCIVSAIESLEDTIRETNEPVQTITYEESKEEIVYVTYEKQEDGDMIYDFGDVSDEYYFYIIINEEQGVYEYYFPAMHIDWPIECDSLEELQDVISCHIEQAYPNAMFVIR
jgi:hypothetical protein